MKVRFFEASVMNLDRIEREINEFCKDKEVVKIDMIEISELIIAMVVYR